MSEISEERIERAAEWIASNILRTAWNGLNGSGDPEDTRIVDRGFPTFCWSAYGSYTFQGRKEDVRDMARMLARFLAPGADYPDAPALAEAEQRGRLAELAEAQLLILGLTNASGYRAIDAAIARLAEIDPQPKEPT